MDEIRPGPAQGLPPGNRPPLEEAASESDVSRAALSALQGGRTGPARVVDRHKYRDEIIEFLAAGWSPRSINAMMARMHPDYEPVPSRTLQSYRRDCIQAAQMRPLEEYQRRLRDEHVLMDPVRERAVLIVLQQARVQQAVDLEKKLEGVVLPIVGQEIDRLAKLWDGYERALERLGLIRRPDGQVGPIQVGAAQQVNVYQMMADQVAELTEEERSAWADLLGRIQKRRRIPPGGKGGSRGRD